MTRNCSAVHRSGSPVRRVRLELAEQNLKTDGGGQEDSVQLMVDRDGTIYRLLPLDRKATGAYGADHVALSIEMVALDQEDLLSRPSQVFASFCLVRWLMERYQIPVTRVHSHFEVAVGLAVFPEFTDLADPVWWFAYPMSSFRYDPGNGYMSLLRRYLLDSPSQTS